MYLQLKAKVSSAEITEVPEIFQQKYFRTLDGLRAISIIWVIVSHVIKFDNSAYSFIFKEGSIGVHVFFVLSGFLITTLLLKEKISNGYISLRNFYIRRFFRIIPVAFLFIFVLLVLNLLLPLNIKSKDFFHLITFTENFNSDGNWYTGHFWSLSIEEQFYLIFPFFIKKNLNLYVKMSGLLILSSPAISYLAHHDFLSIAYLKNTITFLDIFINRGLLSILIGSLTSIILFKLNASKGKKTFGIGFLQMFLLLLIWLLFQWMGFAGISMILSAIVIALLISISMIYEDTFLNKFLNLKYIKLIGVLSYSLYIWQQLFTNYQPWKHWFKYGDSIILNTCALFLVAYISYNFYEKRFIELKNKFNSAIGSFNKRQSLK